MATIRFTLRTDKIDSKTNLCPIELIYQVSGQRKYFRPKDKVQAINWSADDQRAIYRDKATAKKLQPGIDYSTLLTSKEVDALNTDLNGLRKEIADIEKRYELNKLAYSAEMIIEDLKASRSPLTKKEAPVNELFHFIDRYIADHSTTREAGSLSVYKALKNHLDGYQKHMKKRITFESVDYSFFQDFQSYLLSLENVSTDGTRTPRLNNTTIAKQLSTIKTFLNYARLQGINITDQYKGFKIKKDALEVIALTQEEFDSLIDLDLSQNKKLDQVRDIFCFSCATGLRYSDLEQLKREHIRNDEIRLIVTKTKDLLTVPLNPVSHTILDKYSHMHRPLPMISNQKLNDYIKELGKLAGIDDTIQIVRFRGAKREENSYPKYELISVHTGRKTFCTLSLEKGMSAEEVMAISGHKDYQSFKRYVKITEKRTKVVMSKAWGEIRRPELRAV